MSHSTSVNQRRRLLKGRLKSTRNKNLVATGDIGNTWEGNNNGEDESWGDSQGIKSIDTIRIGFQNIGPQSTNKNDLNAKLTTHHITNNDYDIFLFAEHGLNPSRLLPEHQWRERMGKMNTYNILAHNTSESKIGDGRKYGGTGLSMLGNIMHLSLIHI